MFAFLTSSISGPFLRFPWLDLSDNALLNEGWLKCKMYKALDFFIVNCKTPVQSRPKWWWIEHTEEEAKIVSCTNGLFFVNTPSHNVGNDVAVSVGWGHNKRFTMLLKTLPGLQGSHYIICFCAFFSIYFKISPHRNRLKSTGLDPKFSEQLLDRIGCLYPDPYSPTL